MSALQQWIGIAKRQVRNVRRTAETIANEILQPVEQQAQPQLQRVPIPVNENNGQSRLPFPVNRGNSNNFNGSDNFS
ncbi:hypothetical protein ACO0RG_003395 [Hanseniaspora osmophila]|uniref:Uncharacterized protein n=1 Tax=Hanseniaspora osmophila TaxID=56408 RepID=A0A1E5RE28_9ASCO|nr:hypothetical protein AWRI3579_g2038 [Hanseniaspora osmophila]